jgi:ABC-2 type transport system permease protein
MIKGELTGPGTIAWFALHEMRLAWRDWLWLLSGGHSRHWYIGALGLVIVVLLMHGLAYVALPHAADLAAPLGIRMLAVIGGTLVLYGSLMLSQAMESVTRAFYARGDLDLVLSSPAAAGRLFAVRIGAMTASVMGMSLVLAAPVIDVLAWRGGARWLAAYGVMAAQAMAAVAISAIVTILLFAVIGARRTRLVAQIIAAIVGASFVICVQFLAILSLGTMSRAEFLSSDTVVKHIPASSSMVWLPAYAAAGDWLDLGLVMAVAAAMLAGAIRFCAPRFGTIALATVAIGAGSPRASAPLGGSGFRRSGFRPRSPAHALRSKEWVLLRRDPWLMSQSLMQILYLLPPFFMLWQNFYGDSDGVTLLVPVLIMAAGQLAGGLAWLAVSGEDAQDLIGSAPITPARVWRAKAEAVGGVIGMVFGPPVAVLAIVDPMLGLVAFLGIATAAASATLIQFWFRAQVKRSLFRRRHVSSRIATFAEAFSSITWSGAGALALVNPWLAIVPGGAALVVLAGAWSISPRRG